MKMPLRHIACACTLFTVAVSAQSATLVASYSFNDTLAANEASAPALVSINPLWLNQFEDAIVNGVSQRVFRWDGDGENATDNAGLQLDATDLVSYDNYSVELTFEFLETAQFGGGWRRILDTQNRQSDNGFYVSPEDTLQVFPEVSGTTPFFTPGFHTVVLTNFVNGGIREVKGYLDGNLELESDTDQLNLDNVNNPDHLLHFFLDNTASIAQQEFADGRIASLKLYDGIFVPPPIPEPQTYLLMLAGLAGLAWATRRAHR